MWHGVGGFYGLLGFRRLGLWDYHGAFVFFTYMGA